MVSDFNKKGNRDFFNDQLLFKTVGIFFIFFILFMIFEDIKIYQKKQELASQIVTYQKQIKDMENSSQILKNEIANADNTDYLEKLGYEQFGETRPGETEYMFTDSQQKSGTTSKPQNFWDPKMWSAWLTGSLQWIKSKI